MFSVWKEINWYNLHQAEWTSSNTFRWFSSKAENDIKTSILDNVDDESITGVLLQQLMKYYRNVDLLFMKYHQVCTNISLMFTYGLRPIYKLVGICQQDVQLWQWDALTLCVQNTFASP